MKTDNDKPLLVVAKAVNGMWSWRIERKGHYELLSCLFGSQELAIADAASKLHPDIFNAAQTIVLETPLSSFIGEA